MELKYKSTNVGRCLTHTILEDHVSDGLYIVSSQFNNVSLDGKGWKDALMIAEIKKDVFHQNFEITPFRPKPNPGEIIYAEIDGVCRVIEEIIDSSD